MLAAGLTLAAIAHAGGKATKLTVYGGQHPQTVAALVAAFEKQTGIDVAVRSDNESVLAAQIVQEGKHSPADIFLTENSPPLEDLQQRGLLSRVAAGTLCANACQIQLAAAPLAGRLRARQRHGLRHESSQARASCPGPCSLSPTRNGRASLRSRRPRGISSRS